MTPPIDRSNPYKGAAEGGLGGLQKRTSGDASGAPGPFSFRGCKRGGWGFLIFFLKSF